MIIQISYPKCKYSILIFPWSDALFRLSIDRYIELKIYYYLRSITIYVNNKTVLQSLNDIIIYIKYLSSINQILITIKR